jgi:hypothetical protein
MKRFAVNVIQRFDSNIYSIASVPQAPKPFRQKGNKKYFFYSKKIDKPSAIPSQPLIADTARANSLVATNMVSYPHHLHSLMAHFRACIIPHTALSCALSVALTQHVGVTRFLANQECRYICT